MTKVTSREEYFARTILGLTPNRCGYIDDEGNLLVDEDIRAHPRYRNFMNINILLVAESSTDQGNPDERIEGSR